MGQDAFVRTKESYLHSLLHRAGRRCFSESLFAVDLNEEVFTYGRADAEQTETMPLSEPLAKAG